MSICTGKLRSACGAPVPLLVLLGVMLWPAAAAHADTTPNGSVPILMGWSPSSPQSGDWIAPPLSPDAFAYVDGLYRLQGGAMWEGAFGGLADVEVLDLEFHPNPYVLNNILVTNTSATTQTFTMGVVLPTTFGTPNEILGSITTQVIDGNDNGATIAAPTGGSIYQAIIDGFVVATLQDDPFSIVAPVAGVNNALADFGPDGNLLGVNSFIAIKLSFTLSPGDTAAILSRFDVIPEPSSALLLGAASVLLLRRRK
jgi:hypothetical protein